MIGRKDSKGTAAQGSEANEKHIGNWKKEKSCYVVAESLAELCPSVLRKAWLVSNELGIFFWGDSQAKKWKMWCGFSRLLPVKCKRKDVRIREELNQKGSRTWWSGIFLAIQIAKDTEVRSITFKKKCSGYKAKGVAGRPLSNASEGSEGLSIQSQWCLFKENRHMIHGSPQPCQQNTKLKIWLSKKSPWRSSFPNGVDSCDISRKLKRVLKCYTSRNIAGLD